MRPWPADRPKSYVRCYVPQQSRSSARLMRMFVTLCCPAWVIGCAGSVTPPVILPAPTWVPCSLEAPPEELTVRQAEERLIRAEEALGRCDAQGRKALASWPR